MPSSGYSVNSNACPNDNRVWFYTCFQNISQFQLDIVGFLAILGEGSVQANAQVATLSRIVFLPRLFPAPQALMRPSRPMVLDSVKGYTTSVYSGNHRDYINHVGNVLVNAESLPPYSVRCVKIERKQDGEVKAKRMGPLSAVAILGFVMAVTLFGLSIWQTDGYAMLSTICLASLSTLTGVGNKWKLDLPKRMQINDDTPPGDVVVRYVKGNFLVVQCHEDVARELYFAPENVDYFISHSWKYRMISLVGTMLLMTSVICLSNASTYLQIGFAAAYMILNAAYWIVAALPGKAHWDMSCYEVTNEYIDHEPNGGKNNTKPDEELKSHVSQRVHDKLTSRNKPFVDYNKTFTQAMWKAIVLTKDIGWLKRSAAAPRTNAWDVWLQEAKAQAELASFRMENVDGKMTKIWELPDWNPQKALAQAMQDHQEFPKV